jgi:hypothetical protein
MRRYGFTEGDVTRIRAWLAWRLIHMAYLLSPTAIEYFCAATESLAARVTIGPWGPRIPDIEAEERVTCRGGIVW